MQGKNAEQVSGGHELCAGNKQELSEEKALRSNAKKQGMEKWPRTLCMCQSDAGCDGSW